MSAAADNSWAAGFYSGGSAARAVCSASFCASATLTAARKLLISSPSAGDQPAAARQALLHSRSQLSCRSQRTQPLSPAILSASGATTGPTGIRRGSAHTKNVRASAACASPPPGQAGRSGSAPSDRQGPHRPGSYSWRACRAAPGQVCLHLMTFHMGTIPFRRAISKIWRDLISMRMRNSMRNCGNSSVV